MAYAYVLRKGIASERLSIWKGSVAGVALHFQTLGILRQLALAWPPSVEAAFTPFEAFGGSLGVLRPECAIAADQITIPLYYLFNVAPPATRTPLVPPAFD